MVVFVLGSTTAYADEASRIRPKPFPAPNEFIVRVADRGNPAAIVSLAYSIAKSYRGELKYIFDETLGGFSIRMERPDAERLARDPRIEFVEENQFFTLDRGEVSARTIRPVTDASLWFLDRSDQPYFPLDHEYGYCSNGSGVLAYVIDEGVNKNHTEFAPGQVKPGVTFLTQPADNPCTEGEFEESGWHGTAVASVLAGQNYGIASGTTIVPILAITCRGGVYEDRILAAMNWIISDTPQIGYSHNSVNPDRNVRPAVVNMSFYTPKHATFTYNYPESVEIATNDLIERGIVVVTSANNQNSATEDCNQAPARLGRYWNPFDPNTPSADPLEYSTGLINGQEIQIPRRVITAGGSSYSGTDPFAPAPSDIRHVSSDPVNPGSNHGPCVSIFAPAGHIKAAHHRGGWLATEGTSFASPQVAGVLARLMVPPYDVNTPGTENYNKYRTTAIADEVWTALRTSAISAKPDGSPILTDVAPAPSLLLHFNQRCRTVGIY